MALEVFFSGGRLQTAGGLDISGEILANTDTLLFGPGELTPTGTATIVASTNWTGINLPATGTSGFSISRNFPNNWGTASLSFTYTPAGAGAGNVRWQARVFRVNTLGFGDLITDAAATTDTFTQAVGTNNQCEAVFTHPASFQVHNTDSFIGDCTNILVERLGDDAADTAAQAVLVLGVSVGRLS